MIDESAVVSKKENNEEGYDSLDDQSDREN